MKIDEHKKMKLGMRNPCLRDKNEGMYRGGGGGEKPVTMAEGKTCLTMLWPELESKSHD